MRKIYSLKFLSFVGIMVLAATVFWTVVSVCIPRYRAPEAGQQVYSIRHQELKDNNSLYTDLFLKSIEKNNGYLILGTSETGARPKGNYYDFLNADTSLHSKFSVISGAGRTPCVYFPLIQSNANVKGLKLIFYLNPSYGCGKLAYSNSDYFERYVSYTAWRKANHPKNAEVDKILRINAPAKKKLDAAFEFLSYYLDIFRKKFYQDLLFDIKPDKFLKSIIWIDYIDYGKFRERPLLDEQSYNFDLNVSSSFDVNSYTLWPHPESRYRCEELQTMIHLCKERGIDAVFVVGPYNSVAYSKIHPDELPKIEEHTENIIRVLKEEGAQYIDCTDLSSEPGMFDDWQHNTSYGAYFIYQRIKDYVLEKESF